MENYFTFFRKSNLYVRISLTIIMSVFFSLLVSGNKVYLIILVYFIKTFTFKEVISVWNSFRENKKGIFKNLLWYFMIVADIYFVGNSLIKIYYEKIPFFILENFMMIYFVMYIFGIVLFVINLRKSHLKLQFAQLAMVHMTLFIVCGTSKLVILNINKGKFWFVFPATLVIINDIFAYITGKLFGKRKLIRLSPKKTLEGFIGAFVFTFLFGILFSYVRINYSYFGDKLDLVFIERFYIKWLGISIAKIYLHSIVFILFSSFIAPFGGFFASGFKRAFKMKDFGDSIPGHGGITDRMDCQYIMGVFTYVYLHTFIITHKRNVSEMYDYIIRTLDEDGILKITEMLVNRSN
ncbi:phosphatidate cytidylyltransferase [Hamiltosporidium tvaerminnensis]|uniref:Phosphatidate cytidylyltransferase n=2 Tax=Hamiltosporidium TaxID=1176354 RepID=A0A4Q9L2X4_9MICR|nr:phosphatidate cytidylyltransferase [Hamiltosporidium tvaerminnensis]TBT97696.1 phosphatidate cytidylyltransferase [Hamiltosporidium tvaerminnensis]TBU00850.1 phosphatidate cytidylyltransferase [Hamiltosporidium magnivora]TBU02466.1 phosphatidate cytidylyltransferase [Hamiltosporidium magnivora]TBU10044.1 phosphatidate cytidylyltransferase [Hamiltosporidium tvaerminnensis]